MKWCALCLSFFLSHSVSARFEFHPPKDVTVQKVVMYEILLNNLTHLYSDYYFEELMLAEDKEASENAGKASWTDDLRARMKGCPGPSRI